jgi:hypothetical protein
MKITYTYGKTNTSGLSQPLDVYNLTLLKGARPQTPWSYLTSRHAGQDLGYNGIALVVSPGLRPRLLEQHAQPELRGCCAAGVRQRHRGRRTFGHHHRPSRTLFTG